VDQYVQWFGLTDRADFFRHPAPKATYRAWAEHLLLRTNTRTGRQYRDEPAILAWELANEPRCVGRDGDRLPGGVDTLLNWAHEMSSFVKSFDSNHLIAVGDEGWFNRPFAWGNPLYNGAHGVDSEALLALPAIDFGTYHLYPAFAPEASPEAFGTRWIREHLDTAAAAGKPMLLAEFGVKADSPIPRARIVQSWLDEVAASGGAGALLWMIAAARDDGQPYPDYDGYTVYSAAELPALMAFAQSV
jgi:mannan endo-1,4-beta-mannosidase